jgi:acetyl-CoA carboxylase carboxyl transferase subunit alpha
MSYDLEFEKPLAEIDRRIQNLRKRGDKIRPDEMSALDRELTQATAEIYGRLTPWQRVQVARHKDRPYTADYIRFLFPDFFEMRGDRRFGDDRAIIGGMATFAGRTVMVNGHQKGRDTKERLECNFGMAHPEGYRKALRLMQHAERFGFPVLTFIDTAGAFLNLAAEERGIAEAIAENLQVMAVLGVPIISTVIGEGGSGGALGIGVGDRIIMLENSIYTVAAPEAAASILWKSNDAAFAAQAAEAMKITAPDLLELGLIDRMVNEPLGGAHRDHRATAEALGKVLIEELVQLSVLPTSTLLDRRYDRLRAVGAPAGVAV